MTLHQTNKNESERVRQGDIYSNVPYYESYKEFNGEFELTVYEFPYVLVLTQDCDLEQNKTNRVKEIEIEPDEQGCKNYDKHLISVIVAPLYNSEHLFSGKHLDQLKINAHKHSSDQKRLIKQNQNPRYHYIEFGDDVVVPDSVIDFKHYYSVSLDWLESKSKNRICGINSIYRELISQRFSNYLSRIGLP
jgi:hypothetical protein